MQKPIRLGDGVGLQCAILAQVLQVFGKNTSHPRAVDHAINHYMTDVNTAGTVILCQCLGEIA